MKKEEDFQIYLPDSKRVKHWYNIRAEFKDIEPYLTADNKVVKKEDLYPIFAKPLADQEFSFKRFIEIPKEVDDFYRTMRPTPLRRAINLEKALGTPAKLYYKYEGNNVAGSHKLNTAIPQAYYNKISGTTKLTTETGAGQWGTALAVACNAFDLDCEVFMVKCSAEAKPARLELMKTLGATVHKSPTKLTKVGRDLLKKDKNNKGALSIAISEAIEIALKNKNTKYALGSVLNHVSMHQTIIGEECKAQFDLIKDYPDKVIACCGGGSNFAGMAFPFVYDKLHKNKDIDIIGVEPAACPTITKGKYTYDFGDITHFTPKMLQYTLGTGFMPPAMHAGGLRYHGMNPMVSKVMHEKIARAVTVQQKEIFKAGLVFLKHELILAAPESSHAIAQAIKEALICKKENKSKTILFNVTGHGILDTTSYCAFKNNEIEDFEGDDTFFEEGYKTIPEQ